MEYEVNLGTLSDFSSFYQEKREKSRLELRAWLRLRKDK